MNGDQLKARQERDRALATIAHALHQAIYHLRRARDMNLVFALGLDLPSEQPFNDAFAECARVHKEHQP